MKQAIEEGFILDVLKNYTPYSSYYRVLKAVENDPEYDKIKALGKIRAYVERQPETIEKKAEIIVELSAIPASPAAAKFDAIWRLFCARIISSLRAPFNRTNAAFRR
jgi:hypothetical protein